MLLLGSLWLVLAVATLLIQLLTPPKIEIEWITETEFETAGFNIYRSESAAGEFVKINERLIPSQADAQSGATYLYVDEGVERGKSYYYRLEDVEYDNSTEQHEVLSGATPLVAWWVVALAALSSFIGLFLLFYGLKARSEE